ncbi:MAG: ATP-binding protein [Gemmatimonadaceae bacterium]
MPHPLVLVCVTGPESTGKTTLARRLAEWLDTEWVPEASRRYAVRKGSELLASDVSPIAREHIELADDAVERVRARGATALVLDTDLISTVVYARHYYDAVPAWIVRAQRDRRADLYLLCDVDVPWVPDGARDRPENRAAMCDLFRRALAARAARAAQAAGDARTVIIRGDWATRWERARDAVASLGIGRTPSEA